MVSLSSLVETWAKYVTETLEIGDMKITGSLCWSRYAVESYLIINLVKIHFDHVVSIQSGGDWNHGVL